MEDSFSAGAQRPLDQSCAPKFEYWLRSRSAYLNLGDFSEKTGTCERTSELLEFSAVAVLSWDGPHIKLIDHHVFIPKSFVKSKTLKSINSQMKLSLICLKYG